LNRIDLHVHSCFSDDGEVPPEALVDRGHGLGLAAMAITDHNSVKGVGAALRHGDELNVEVIPGIEIDCDYQGLNLHLLGYFIDWTRPEYERLEENILTQEHQAVHLKLDLMKKLGLQVDEASVVRAAQGGIVSGEIIAEHLLRQPGAEHNPLLRPYLPGGSRDEMPLVNFYWDFFAQGGPAHVPMRFPSLDAAVDLVKSSGGVPILAHPGVNLKDRMDMLGPILAAGVAGLEVFSTYHDPEQQNTFLEIARQKSLLVTCGSDFHGKNKPNIELGGHNCELDSDVLVEALRSAAVRSK
jgi:3',5'-nucleoside bisphosphate phosphatase